MKLLLTVVALVAVAHGAPTTQTMEIGASGVSGSLLNIPLVEIIVNMISNEAAVAPGTVNEPVIEAEPVIVVDDAQLPTPVIVVDQPEVNPIDVVAVNPAPAPVVVDQPEANPIDVVAVNPAPAPVVVDQPEVNPVDVIAVN
ncbi:magnetosome-associated protein MamJ-like, partial [Cydia fagiglandana]|uniref:magnetosome-associated protein MamJ-like n=1 Tax=Cydia fagiglandana TaxID=1458189 RepID=UPI002FEE4C8A